MSLQPKTRKYRLSFRNKTDKFKKKPLKLHSAKSDKSFFCDMIKATPYRIALYNDTQKANTLFRVNNLKANRELATNVWPERVSKITSALLEQPITPNSMSIKIATIKLPSCFTTTGTHSKALKELSFFNTFELTISESKLGNKGEFPAISEPSLPVPYFAPSLSSASLDKVRYGSYGIFFSNYGSLSTKYIETVRLLIAKKLKKMGRFWIRVSPDTPVTARSAETRMGRGKGAISHYEAKIRPGQMFLEFSGVQEENVRQIYRELTKKTAIPIKLL